MDKRIQRKKWQDGEKAVDRRILPEPVEVNLREGERREQDAEVEDIRKKYESLKAQKQREPGAIGTWTFRLGKRREYKTEPGRISDDFAEIGAEDTYKDFVGQGYGKITNEDETLESMFASTCLYLCLSDPEKKLTGLAHVSSTYGVSELLDEWLKLTDAQQTKVYIVKGNGKCEAESATDIITYVKSELTDRDFEITKEDIDEPVAGEPRGDNTANITLKKDGKAEVVRFHDASKGIAGDKTTYEIDGNRIRVIE